MASRNVGALPYAGDRGPEADRLVPKFARVRCRVVATLGRTMTMRAMAERVAAGETVSFRPAGASMVPLIRSRQLVTVVPCDPAAVEVGDIVLARVAGADYLHLVSAVDHARGRVQISNNRGRVNGWTTHARVYGICTAVDGKPRPRVDGKGS